MTARRPENLGFQAVSVTCAECGTVVPPDVPVVIGGGYGRVRGGTRTVCVTCAKTTHDGLLLPWGGYGWRKRREDYEHRCAACGRFFYGAMQRVYCSDRCGERTRAQRRDRVTCLEPRPCATCGTWFTPPRDDGRYCSHACRQRAYRQRRASPGPEGTS